jgi:hypothetical protein
MGLHSEVDFGCGSGGVVALGFDTYWGGGGVDNFTLEMQILSCSPFHAIATAVSPSLPLTVDESSFLTNRPSVLCGSAGTSTFSVEIHE